MGEIIDSHCFAAYIRSNCFMFSHAAAAVIMLTERISHEALNLYICKMTGYNKNMLLNI